MITIEFVYSGTIYGLDLYYMAASPRVLCAQDLRRVFPDLKKKKKIGHRIVLRASNEPFESARKIWVNTWANGWCFWRWSITVRHLPVWATNLLSKSLDFLLVDRRQPIYVSCEVVKP